MHGAAGHWHYGRRQRVGCKGGWAGGENTILIQAFGHFSSFLFIQNPKLSLTSEKEKKKKKRLTIRRQARLTLGYKAAGVGREALHFHAVGLVAKARSPQPLGTAADNGRHHWRIWSE